MAYRRRRYPVKRRATRRRSYARSYGGTRSTIRRRAKKYIKRGRRSTSTGSSKVPQYLVANLNPFDPGARGVRIPDTNTVPSSGFHTLDEGIVKNNGVSVAGGLIMNAFRPQVVSYLTAMGADTTSAVKVTFADCAVTDVNKKSAVASAYTVVRPVAHGVKLWCPLAATAAAGMVHVCLYSGRESDTASYQLPNSITGMRECPFYRRMSLASLTQNPLFIANKFLDATAYEYKNPNVAEAANTAALQNAAVVAGVSQVPSAWMTIVVAVDGHGLATDGTAAVLNFENIIHFEGQAYYGGLNGDNNAEPSNAKILDSTAAAIAETDAVYTDPGLTPHLINGMRVFMSNAIGMNIPMGVTPQGGTTAIGGIPGLTSGRAGSR